MLQPLGWSHGISCSAINISCWWEISKYVASRSKPPFWWRLVEFFSRYRRPTRKQSRDRKRGDTKLRAISTPASAEYLTLSAHQTVLFRPVILPPDKETLRSRYEIASNQRFTLSHSAESFHPKNIKIFSLSLLLFIFLSNLLVWFENENEV